MNKFRFFDRFKELDGLKGVLAGNKTLMKLCVDKEVCLGNRQVGNRSYHIFYIVNEKQFCLYYHGGGTDSMFSTVSLDEMLNHVNSLTE